MAAFLSDIPTMWQKTNKVWWYSKIVLVSANDVLAGKTSPIRGSSFCWLCICYFMSGCICIEFYYYITPWEIFTLALTDSLLLEPGWEWVSSGFFSVFWPILTMLLSGWSLLVRFPTPPDPLPSRLGIVSRTPIITGIIFTFNRVFSSPARSKYCTFSLSFIFVIQDGKVYNSACSIVIIIFCQFLHKH